MSTWIGSSLGPYEILAPLGEGGMGEVYRARDSRLGREVAVKLVRAGMVNDDEVLRRFRGEAIALSRLSHPNVATVFDVGTHEGIDYLVMELIPGVTLSDRLREGPLTIAELMPLVLQLAEGLAAAHEQGIVHRDLKPANVRVTPEGRLKVVDFGLARETEAAPGAEEMATMTMPGRVVGTLAYLAPEVMNGARADERSDVFALGVVLYEMATGRHPWPGTTPLQILNAMANRQAPSPRVVRPELPDGLEDVILDAMQREPARRPATAGEVLERLKRLADRTTATRRVTKAPSRSARSRVRSLVVLPLDNLSGDPAQDFFADGMTESLIADLAKIDGLRVISRTSAMRYKGARRPLPEIAAELGVDAVVEGSVLRAGGRVRVTAQLIHAVSDTHLWADSFDRDTSDVLELQSEVARAIAAKIQITLSPRSKARLTSARRIDPEAHEAYLRGRHHMNRRTEEGLLNAIDYFRHAIDTEPTYALAYVGLGDVQNLLGYYGLRAPSEAYTRSKAAARRAMELDPTVGEAHATLAYALHYYDWDWDGAEREYRRCIELCPSYAQGALWYMNLLGSRARWDEALAQSARTVELDPLAPIGGTSEAWLRYFMREHERALVLFRHALELDRNFGPGHLWGVWPCVETGRFDEAFQELDASERIFGDTMLVRLTRAWAHARAGQSDRARALVDHSLAERAERHVPAYLVAVALEALGDHEPAWDWLERAVTERDNWLVFLDVEPRFDPFKADPRFADLRRRVGV